MKRAIKQTFKPKAMFIASSIRQLLKIKNERMKTTIKILTFFLATIFLYNCRDEYKVPNHFSDVMFLTSTGNPNRLLYPVFAENQGFYLTFLDLSQGAISHQWSIAGQDGLKFLSPGFSTLGADSLSRPNHILPDSVLNDLNVNVYFQKEGIYTVTMKDVFPDSVGYVKDPSVFDSVTHHWVFTKVLTIQVYGKLIPNISILKNNTEVIPVSVDTIRLSLGDTLTFSEASTGYPSSIQWKIAGGVPASGTTPVITSIFNTTGIFKGSNLILSRVVNSNIAIGTTSLTTPLPVIKVQ